MCFVCMCVCVCVWTVCSTFFRKNYAELKMLNPRTPFIYREAEEMEPFVYARFGASRVLSMIYRRTNGDLY